MNLQWGIIVPGLDFINVSVNKIIGPRVHTYRENPKIKPVFEMALSNLKKWFKTTCSDEAVWEQNQLYALIRASWNPTTVTGYPFKLKFREKQDVLNDPTFYICWKENIFTNVSLPVPKNELVDMKLHIDKMKVRTFFPTNFYHYVTAISYFGRQSIRFLENGKDCLNNGSWNYYGFTPFFNNVDRLARKFITAFEKKQVITTFDVSGWDRKLPLVEYINMIRFMAITNNNKFPDWYCTKWKHFVNQDSYPSVIIPNDGDPYLYRNLMNPSGKYGTTECNSCCHFVIKEMHKILRDPTMEYGIYSDDNFNIGTEEFQSEKLWRKTYSWFGLDIRDFTVIRSIDDFHLFKFLGFSIRKHWRHDFYAPVFDETRIHDALMVEADPRPEVEVQRWWGLCLLAYAASESLFNWFLSFRHLLVAMSPGDPMCNMCETVPKIMQFYDAILFGMESDFPVKYVESFSNFAFHLFQEVGGIKNENEFSSKADFYVQKDHRFSPCPREGEEMETTPCF